MLWCRNKEILSILSFLVLVILTGCNASYDENYEVGIIQTQEYKKESKISFYDENLQLKNQIAFSYPNIAYDGFCNSLIKDDMLFLLPKGHADKLDYGKVISLSLTSGEVKEYEIGRTNITSVDCDGNNIYAASNLDGLSFIDCCNLETKEVQSCEIDEYVIDTVVAGNNSLYALAMDMDKAENVLCTIDVENQRSKEVYRIHEEMDSTYLIYHNERLYFVNQNLLYEYIIETEQMVTHQLPHTNAFNLLLKDEKLYIGCTDLFEQKVSYIDVFDTENGQIKQLLKTDNTILQMEITDSGNEIYVLGYDTLSRYNIVDSNGKKESEMTLPEEEDFYIGGFYVK